MAHVIPFPNSAASPVQQHRGPGRHPKTVVSLRSWRAIHRTAAAPSADFLIGMEQGRRAAEQQLASERELLRLFESTANTVRNKVALLQQQCSQTPHGR